MKKNNVVKILLASYNGEKYINEQIDSIIQQTYQNWKLIIRDDGSSDNTISIINEYCEKDKRIILFDDSEKHVGAKNSFIRLLEYVEGELFMFCDQDDVWLPNKIELSIQAYNNAKNQKSDEFPIIVHTDATLVDAELNILANSYWKTNNIQPERLKSYNLMAIECCVQGTTMLFNDACKKLCFPHPMDIRMHDFWVSTRLLRAGGHIETVYEPTLLYRQHGNNVYGVRFGKSNTFIVRLQKIKDVVDVNINKYNYLKTDGYGSIFKYLYYRIKLYLLRYNIT